jgi:PKD repeat protein
VRWRSLLAFVAIVVFAPLALAGEPRIVAATASATSGKAPLSVSLSAQRLDALRMGALDFQWIFDDGTSASGPRVSHLFREPRVHRVRLVATGHGGRQETHELSLSVVPPVAATGGVVIFDNGAVNTIADARFDSSPVEVSDAPNGAVTTLRILPGASIFTSGFLSGPGLLSLQHSVVSILGGTIGSAMVATDQSSVSLAGGTHPGEIGIQGNARFAMSGGQIVSDVPSFLMNSATLEFSGGTLTGSLTATDSAFARISGGALDFLNVGGSGNPDDAASFRMNGGVIGPRFAAAIQFNGIGTGRIEGGSIHGDLVVGNCCDPSSQPRLSIRGGELEGALDVRQGVTKLVGRGFDLPYGPVEALAGTIHGEMADGTPIAVDFDRGADGQIVLVLPAAIDIKPGSDRNPMALRSRGVLPIAILGSEDLDVADVDLRTLVFGPGNARALDRHAHLEDVNGDGFLDLVARFRATATEIARGDDEACVDGALMDGTPFEGCDSIHPIGHPKVKPKRK